MCHNRCTIAGGQAPPIAHAAFTPRRPHRIQSHLSRHTPTLPDLIDEPAPFVDKLDLDTAGREWVQVDRIAMVGS